MISHQSRSDSEDTGSQAIYPSIGSRSIAAVIPAAGRGQRFGRNDNKLFALLAGQPLWTHCVSRLARRDEVAKVLIGVHSGDQARFEEQAQAVFGGHPEVLARIEWFTGGKERSDTTEAAMQRCGNCPWIAIHDAARPLISDRDLSAVFTKASQAGAAILASPVTGTLKRENVSEQATAEEPGCRTVSRDRMWVAHTPQVFRVDWMRQAYARHRGRGFTDDAQIVERDGRKVTLVSGSSNNLKITYPDDLVLAEALLTLSSQADSR